MAPAMSWRVKWSEK